MEQFLRQLQTIPEAAELIRRVEEGGCPAAVSGLQPVQRACVGAAVAAACGRPAVFLCGDEREVQVLSADLETLTGKCPVTLLGREWQFRPGAVGSRDWERSRLAALYALAQGDAPVVVATADGLMARTLPPETLRSLAITLEVGGQAELGALAEQLLSAGYTRCEQVEGVGIGVPGPVLDSSVVPIVCANLGGWGQRNVSAQLSGLLDGLKVLVGNDANVAALGEIWMGAAKGCRSAVMVTLGTGVGGGTLVGLCDKMLGVRGVEHILHLAEKGSLSNVDLTISPGRIVGLLGPNGSGKSTLIKLANGLLTPTQGTILVDGKEPGIETKKIVSYLPERTYLTEWMTVQDMLDLFNDFYADFNIAKARDMLARLNIQTKARIKTMSKGTKEKVQLILVMSREAQLYLLDEPIGGVDPAARDYILNTIIANYNENATVLISTHLISDVEQILDDVIFINQGSVVLTSSVDDIREKQDKSVDALFREVFRC